MIKALRFIAIGLYVAVVTSLGILISILRPRHPNNLYIIAKMLAWKSFDILGVDFKKRGDENHRDLGPAVYCSNHQNNLDMFPGGACIQERTVVLGKDSIIWIPFFGQFFWLSGNILIRRGNPTKARESMNKLTKRITEDKISVWVMPEGTRSRGRGLLPFKKGAFVTAIEAGSPIAPIVFSSYSKQLNLNKLKSGVIIAECLPPISTVGMVKEDAAKLKETTYNMMNECLQKLDAELKQNNIHG